MIQGNTAIKTDDDAHCVKTTSEASSSALLPNETFLFIFKHWEAELKKC